MKTQLEQFRQDLYEIIPNRRDAVMDLLDALSSNTTARSVVDLCLTPPFRRGYGSVYTAIGGFFQAGHPDTSFQERRRYDQELMRLIVPRLPPPKQRKFWLFGLDVTPAPRPFARTLEDRGFVYQPNTIRGNKPVAIGHQYSTLAFLPEKIQPRTPPWIVPVTTRRVRSFETGTDVGVGQVKDLLGDEALPFQEDLCVEVEDSAYSGVPFLGPMTHSSLDNLVTVARLRGTRTVYRPALPPEEGSRKRGRPPWFGERFSLKDETTWGPPDEEADASFITHRGRIYRVHIEGWHSLLMRGTKEYAMHKQPFTVMRCRVFNEKGELVFQRPLWLLVIGPRRDELSLIEAWESYRQRYDMEHFYRFGKQRLLMNAFQTPVVEHEENWWWIVQLAYVQLWMARSMVHALLKPWERYLPRPTADIASPAATRRDFGRIIRQIGTPAEMPKPRGKSPGRAVGQRMRPRPRQQVIKKGKEKPQNAQLVA